MSQAITIEHAVAAMNSMHKCDPTALRRLLEYRVSCNEELADHPTCQVGAELNKYDVGMLGVINGIFGVVDIGSGYIAALVDEDTGDIQGFIDRRSANGTDTRN